MRKKQLTAEERSAAGRILNALRRTHGGGRPKVFRRCKNCGEKLGAREMLRHKCEGGKHAEG